MHEITQAKRRAAVEALGFDPDVVVSVSLATDHASILIAKLNKDGHPLLADGALVTESLTGPIEGITHD